MLDRRSKLVPQHIHFEPNTWRVLQILSSHTNSGGASALGRRIIEYYLSEAVNFNDPIFRECDRVSRPSEKYRGQHEKLRLA